MSILFLDIDGVMNSLEHKGLGKGRISGLMGIDQFHVQHLKRIVDETGCSIVLSSTWRCNLNWKRGLSKHGMPKSIISSIIDRTPITMDRYRGEEIDMWLKDNKFEGVFAIVDDDSDMEPHMDKLVKTSYRTGLTSEIADLLIQNLKEKRT